jgi:hypothetical protein
MRNNRKVDFSKVTQTAADAYLHQREIVEQLIADLQAKLVEHERKQQADSRNWGWAGDMAHIANCLNEALGNEA